MLWTAGTLLKQTREGTWTYRIRAAYANQVYLGKGGCGITYLADCLEGEHQRKRVVIKTILDEHYDRPDFLQIKNDFWAEAFRLRGCTHSHIVQVWDLFQEPIIIPTIQTRASVGFLERGTNLRRKNQTQWGL